MVRRRSTVRFCQGARWRRSSVGESARLIIERSTVRICPSLPAKMATRPAEETSGPYIDPEVRNRHGIRQASSGHPGVPGVQASQLHNHQVEGEHPRAHRAQEILPVVPFPRRPQGNPLTPCGAMPTDRHARGPRVPCGIRSGRLVSCRRIRPPTPTLGRRSGTQGSGSIGRAPVSKTGGWGFESLLPCKVGRGTVDRLGFRPVRQHAHQGRVAI